MATITFQRCLRDSQSNAQRVAAGDKTGLIYDFKVLIDGEHRATLHRSIYSKGYTLWDADRRPIKVDWRNTVEIDRKSNFEPVVRGLLDTGKILTLAQMAALRDQEAAKKAEKRAAQEEQDRIGRIKDAALALYEALQHAKDELVRLHVGGACVRPDVTHAVMKAIAKAEGRSNG